MDKNQLITITQKACHRVPNLEFALFTLVTIFEKFSFKLQSFIITDNNHNAANIQFFTDC